MTWRMTARGPEPEHPAAVPGLRSVLEGFRCLRGRQALQGAYLVDLCGTLFGLPRPVFPALTREVFHGGPVTLGTLYVTPAAGALAGTSPTVPFAHLGFAASVIHRGARDHDAAALRRALPLTPAREVPLVILADHGFRMNPSWGFGLRVVSCTVARRSKSASCR